MLSDACAIYLTHWLQNIIVSGNKSKFCYKIFYTFSYLAFNYQLYFILTVHLYLGQPHFSNQ